MNLVFFEKNKQIQNYLKNFEKSASKYCLSCFLEKHGNSTVNDFLVVYFYSLKVHNLNMIQSHCKDMYCRLKSSCLVSRLSYKKIFERGIMTFLSQPSLFCIALQVETQPKLDKVNHVNYGTFSQCSSITVGINRTKLTEQ